MQHFFFSGAKSRQISRIYFLILFYFSKKFATLWTLFKNLIAVFKLVFKILIFLQLFRQNLKACRHLIRNSSWVASQ
jgi:hypothetical protein